MPGMSLIIKARIIYARKTVNYAHKNAKTRFTLLKIYTNMQLPNKWNLK